MVGVMATSYLDNSQRSVTRNSITQPPASPSPNYYLQNNTSSQNMNIAMSAPPTPSQPHMAPLSMYSPLHVAPNTPIHHGSGHGGAMKPGSNHSSLGGGSSHARPSLPNGAPRKVIMQQQHKAASSRAVMMHSTPQSNGLLSPQPHGRRRSLVGFDPMLADSTVPSTPSQKRYSMQEFASAPTTRRTVSPKAVNGLSPPSAPFSFHSNGAMNDGSGHNPNPRPVTPPQAAPAQPKSLTPKEKPSKPMTTKTQKQHRKGVQSFCVSDLRSISQEAADDEDEIAVGVPTPPKTSSTSQPVVKQPAPRATRDKTPPKSESKSKQRNSLLTIRAPSPKKENESPASASDESKSSKKDSSTSPPRSRKLPFLKKGHRRTRSLESKEILPAAKTAGEAVTKRPLSSATPASSERKQSMYPGVVQDLMDIKFNNLQIPSLAKPSPTSFLTGKEDEVKRTCELEPAPHQMEIPTLPEFVVIARLNEFVENYRRVDQNFDLQQLVGKSRMDLRQIKIPQHLPIAQSLLECGDNVCLEGVISKGTISDDRLECVVFQGQRQFMAVFRGTTEQQTKLNTKTKKKTCPLDKEHPDVEVYQCFLEEYVKMEAECFALLDQLTEENPFCDVVFSGHSFGAAMSTLAAFRYSNARPMMRVSCLTLASPKVGFSIFRNMVNSQPNLKVMRLEFGQDGKCQLPGTGGSHVGHTVVLHGSLGHNSLKSNQPVLAYKFEVPKHKKFKTTHPDLRSYVTALEELARLNLPWAKDFVGTSGQGVVVNNEARRMV